eukprot:gene9121-10697_t
MRVPVSITLKTADSPCSFNGVTPAEQAKANADAAALKAQEESNRRSLRHSLSATDLLPPPQQTRRGAKSPASLSPTTSQQQFPAFYQHSQKTIRELDDKRLLLIEHLKSVKFNLDTQTEDDPISFIKIRMELTKRKTSLETELRALDDLLNTKSLVEDANPTPMDGITNFLSMIIPSGTSTASSTSSSFSAGGSDIEQVASLAQHHHSLPNSIIPTATPLDIADPNHPRFPPRENINVKLYVDCDDYFAASAQAIENATREVFITAWFLSPEVYLIRYPTLDEKYRLDNLLCRKAKQGVKIFIILWDETKIATFKGSKRCKDKLEELHHNIKVIKHPPFTTLIVDQEIAFVGGVDFCFGRFDTWNHHLIDVKSTLWPGKDYYNPCLGEMGDILSPFDDSIDRKKIPRMPWHDVMVGVNGLAARDVALNFILRWNHHKDDYYPQIHFNTTPLPTIGTSTCQLLRSMDEWSGGHRIERSIHTAYIQAIEDADHYIYIENQNFVSTHAPGVWNQISGEIVKRIRRAIRKHEVFRVIIMLPAQQDGKFQDETHIRGLMHWQYLTLCRSENSMVRTLRREFPNVDLTEYIGFYSLRTHACLEGSYVTEQIYVHSKLMIVDDRVVIVGSANINDRSFIGERDSELAFIVRDDKDMIKTRMNGKDYMASRFAYNLRLRLWKEHIGLLPHIDHPSLSVPPASSHDTVSSINSSYRIPRHSHHRSSSFQGKTTPNKLFSPNALLHYEGVEESVVGGIDLTDPVDSTFYLGVWIATAASNTRIYDTVFHAIPKNSIRTVEEFNLLLKKPICNADTRLLSEVRGNLVNHSLDFLADEDIQPTFLFTDDLFQ